MTVTDERLVEMKSVLELPIGAAVVKGSDLADLRSILTELQSLRAQGGATVGEAVALDGPELFEIIFGAFKGDVPEELTDAKLSEIAASINEAFALTAALAPSTEMAWECKDYADGWIRYENLKDALAYQFETGCVMRPILALAAKGGQ